jgi:dihydrofolate reductase
MSLRIIVAVADGGVIGAGGGMPWHISEDLQYFKRTTTGHAVVMGRRTFESLGRPLPNRTNVVVTHREDYRPEGVEIVHSLEEAVRNYPDAFIIGGAEIYRQAMPLADELYLTRVHAAFDGDVYFPEWDRAEWTLVSSEYHERGADFPHPFEFLVYARK